MESSRLRDFARDAVLGLLLSLGLVLPMIGIMDLLPSFWLQALICVSAVSLLCASLYRIRHGALLVLLTALLCLACWLIMGGVSLVRDTADVFAMHQSGMTSLLLAWSRHLVLPMCVLTAFFACFTVRVRGSALALTAVGLLLLLLWMTKTEHLIWLLIPSCAASLALFAGERCAEPVSWKVLLLTLTVSILTAAAIPLQGLTVQPLQEAADDLRQTLLDRYFFTEPRNLFSLAREGYYPLGQQQLGGKPNLSDHPVMTVETSGKVYLRGAILDTYTGSCWTDSTAASRYLWDSPRWLDLRSGIFEENLPVRDASAPISVHVTMLTDHVSTLCVPQRIRSMEAENGLVLYFNDSSEVFTTRDLSAGDAYRLTALNDKADDPGMAERLDACAAIGDSATDRAVIAAYTSLPAHLNQQPEVVQMAAQAAGSAGTRYAQAMAIQRWLSEHCVYSLDVAAPNPQEDFVSAFLIQTRKGYCTYFASAMTVLCRMNGIPARYIEGYTAIPGPDGIAHVTGLNGHAWVEIWFPGYGWLTFDPTPPTNESGSGGQNDPQRAASTPPPAGQQTTPPPPENDQAPSTGDAQQAPQEDRNETDPRTNNDSHEDGGADETRNAAPGDPNSSWWIWLLIALAVLSALVILVSLRIRGQRPDRMASKASTEERRWQIWMLALCDELRALGHIRPAEQTFAQWMASLEKTLDCASLGQIGESAGVIFYAHEDPLPEETGAVSNAFNELWKRMAGMQKIRFILSRALRRNARFPAA